MRRRKGLLCGLMCVVVALMLAIARGDTAVADTTVSGYISADTTWTAANSPYSVTGNVIVRSSATLTIEPGVTVNFNADKALQIDGGLIAKGTSASPITFTGGNDASTGATAKWAYILFSDSSTDAAYNSSTGDYASGSIMEYCTVEYAGGTSVSYNGAIRLNNAHPFINYCTIQNNSAPGIYAYNISGTLKITNNTITDNNSSGSGGAGVYVSHSSAVATTISGNTIKNNTASSGYPKGGGIYIYYGRVTLTNNTISGNTVSANSDASGGGIYSTSSTMTLTNNTVSDNTASSLYGYPSSGGGIYSTSSTMTLTNNTISGNTASSGGGIYSYSTMTFTNNTISSNIASSGDGGGIYNNSTMTLTNNTISGNTASSGKGGGICTFTTTTLTNNTISSNTAKNAAAVYFGNADGKDFQYNTITGNKATGGSDSYAVIVNSYPLINYNNIYDNTATYELWFNKSQGSANLDAKNNWWGSSDDSTVQGKIYDGIDDSAKALVDYYPYSTAIRTDTGATGTTTPTPTPTVTSTPTPTPSPTPTTSPAPTLSPLPTPVASPSPAPTLPPSPTPQVSPSPIPEGMVFGIVMDENGDSLRGVTVTIANGKTQSTETDEYGYYEFSGLEAGEYTLTFEKSGYTNWTLDITLKAEEILEAETITMELEVKGSIYGYVVDIQGNPIESVRLKLKGLKTKIKKNASSDKDGFFEFADLEKDKYIIFASKKRYKKAQQTVNLDEGDDQEIEIEMRKSSRSRTVIPEAEE